jgi:hypothetical protein
MSRFVIALCFAAVAAKAQVNITIDRNIGDAARAEFKFERVPSPSASDAATRAEVILVAGAIDANSGGLATLTDGRLPTEEDQPQSNLFFRAGTWGGRVRFDLGHATDIAAIDSYSWHPDSRAPQLYKVYGSDGTEPNLNLAPPSRLDPATCGWKLIAFVDTRSKTDEGGQYGVRIDDRSGRLGKYRYLLFDFFDTEGEDNWGNTFYSEIDVLKTSSRSQR